MVVEVVLRENLVYGMEAPLLDMIADVDDGIIDKYKLKRNSRTFFGNCEAPIFNELLEKYDVRCHGGGGTYNSLKIFQWMVQEPKKVATFVACVGRDNLGEILKNDAPNEYLDIHYYEMDKELTGTCAVLVNNAQCTFLSRHGGIDRFNEDFFETAENWLLIEKAEYYYMAGFFLVVGTEEFVKLGKYACDNNKVFIIAIGGEYITISYKDGLVQVLPYSDYIFCNESEAKSLANSFGFESNDINSVAKWMRELPKENKKRERIVIITRGANDTIVATSEGIIKYPVVPMDPKDVVDTTGAGDAFAGGFLSQLVRGKPLGDCIKAANYAANFIIKRYGCNYPMIKPRFP